VYGVVLFVLCTLGFLIRIPVCTIRYSILANLLYSVIYVQEFFVGYAFLYIVPKLALVSLVNTVLFVLPWSNGHVGQ